MISQCIRLEDIQAELKKCIAVCPSCHAEIEKELISYREVLERVKEKYSECCRPGENIHVGFTEWMSIFTIVWKYDIDYIKNERTMHDLELDYLE